jgi:hypothetical protein
LLLLFCILAQRLQKLLAFDLHFAVAFQLRHAFDKMFFQINVVFRFSQKCVISI